MNNSWWNQSVCDNIFADQVLPFEDPMEIVKGISHRNYLLVINGDPFIGVLLVQLVTVAPKIFLIAL
jgi:hypothetical protein